MNYSDIETYLELVRTRNITKASEHLYVSQSTVSNRLKNLENELGFALVIRGKGRQAIELTQKGEEFIVIAEQWRNLHEETEALREASFSKLRIATNESSYYTKLAPFLLEFGQKNPQLRFSVQICDSEKVYDLVDKGIVDFGFASYEADYPRLRAEEIDRQKLCIASSTELPMKNGSPDTEMLDPLREIRFSGGHFSAMESWREQHLLHRGDAALTINAGLGAMQYFQHSGYWSVLPEDMALFLVRQYDFYIYPLPEELDPWRVYMLSRRDVLPDRQALYKNFVVSLNEFASSQQNE